MSDRPQRDGIAGFGQAHGLADATARELPKGGGLLSIDTLTVDAAVSGALPGGIEGTLAHLTYTYRSDDTTHTVRLTTVVGRVPEAIGFAPYLGYGAVRSAGREHAVRQVKLDSGVSIMAEEGIDDAWLRELFSPALCEWVARSPEGFEFELADGVLAVSHTEHLSTASDLTRLCGDAAHLAAALREESIEEVDSGGAQRSAAKPSATAKEQRVGVYISLLTPPEPPTDVAAATAAYRELILRTPGTYISAFLRALLITIGVSVLAGGIYGLLLTVGDPLINAILWESGLLLLIFFLTFRSRVNGDAAGCAGEAFYRGYAASRGLELIDPLGFAATHAEAVLPGKPVRVLSGPIEGFDAALMLTGDGLERGHSIALVAGPSGPIATADLEVSAPGVSAVALDAFSKELALDLRTAPGNAG